MKVAILTAAGCLAGAAAVAEEICRDYPKREVEDYRFALENGDREQAVVVECLYELDANDAEAVTSVFGPKALKDKTFTRKTYYGKARKSFG